MPEFTANGGPLLLLGRVMHRRLRPHINAFIYPVFYCLLPLSRLEETRRGVFSVNRFNLLGFHFADHGARDGSAPLAWIRQELARQQVAAAGEIWLQCFPRVLGFVFNPVSFWFCHDTHGALRAVLAEVSNTFGERYSYLLQNPDGAPLRDGQTLVAPKVFHVSPFCPVAGAYRFRFHRRGGHWLARIDYADGDGELLQTAISGSARAWSTAALLGAFLRMPFLTIGVVLRIHWQALKLWVRGAPFVRKSHPPLPEIKP